MKFRTFTYLIVAAGLVGTGWVMRAHGLAVSGRVVTPVPLLLPSAVGLQSSLEIVNPTLATFDLRFEPTEPVSDTQSELFDDSLSLELSVSAVQSQAPERSFLDELRHSVQTPAFIPFRTTDAAGQLLLSEGQIDHGYDGGWTDGYDRNVVTLPGMQWQTDWNSRFSLGISHQTYRDSTDIGVMGIFSVEF